MVYLSESMDFYQKGRVESCQAAEPNQYFWDSIDALKAKWYQFYNTDSDEDDDEGLEEIDVLREWCSKGNIGIICTGDDYNYHLTNLITNIHETGESGMDDNHEMPVHQKVSTSSFMEIIKI